MSFLKSDISRNFAIGFIVGGLIVAFQISPDFGTDIIPHALAGVIR